MSNKDFSSFQIERLEADFAKEAKDHHKMTVSATFSTFFQTKQTKHFHFHFQNGSASSQTDSSSHRRSVPNVSPLRSSSQQQKMTTPAWKQQLKEEREGIVLWKRPLTTVHYSVMELGINVLEWVRW